MAMVGTELSAARLVAIAGVGAPAPGETPAQYRVRVFDADSAAIVSYIQTHAVVVVTSVSGVTPGPGVSGAGAGTVS